MTEFEKLIWTKPRPPSEPSHRLGVLRVAAPFSWFGLRRLFRHRPAPQELAFVSKGTRYKVVRDFVAYYHISFQAPFSTGGYVFLPAGSLLTAEWDSPAGSDHITLELDGREAVEAALVSEDYRVNTYYAGWNIQVEKSKLFHHVQLAG